MAEYIIPVLIQQQHLCYDSSDANPAQTPSCLIPPLFCLSILKTFIPHSKIYGTERQMPAHYFLTVFYALRRSAQRLPLNLSLY